MFIPTWTICFGGKTILKTWSWIEIFYPHIIWYLQRAQNDKLFKRITRDPLELVRHIEDECHIWFDSNTIDIAEVQSLHHPVTAKDACKLAEHLYGG